MTKLDCPEYQTTTTTTWDTWREFLLASAVDRHGEDNWDTIASEMQRRSPALQVYTPQLCQQKFLEIQQRYAQNDTVVQEINKDDNDNDSEKTKKKKNQSTVVVPWLGELRKLRVEQLTREVERFDLNIVELESKVKRLKEEREKSLSEEQEQEAKKKQVDLGKNENQRQDDDDVVVRDVKSEPGSTGGDKPGSSDKENQSVNESNSTDLKVDDKEKENRSVEPEPVHAGEGPVREDSCDGSSKPEPERVSSGHSPELGESVAESKGEGREEEVKESSDVQSSASLSRKKEEEEEVEPGEPEGRESKGTNRMPKESQPLMEFLEMLRGHKIIESFFERRLESQDSTKYTDLIRQHIDFQIIHTRLQEGHYAGCRKTFFRDLLLLANNALVFFGEKSSEFKAAVELRQLVQKEMAGMGSKSEPSSNLKTPVVGLPSMRVKPELADSLLAKSKLALPLTACRKRSSITAKASSSSSGADRRRVHTGSLLDEKPILDSKQVEKSPTISAEEPRPTQKRTRDRFPLGGKSSNKNAKIQSSANKNVNTNLIGGSDKGENSGAKTEKKNQSSISAKKQSAADFLNRMKQSPSSSNSVPAESLKSSKNKPESAKVAINQKKNVGGKNDARRDQRKGSGAKQVKEKESPSKKNVGRPPKRGAASPPSLPAKRTREASETGGSRQARKRSRK